MPSWPGAGLDHRWSGDQDNVLLLVATSSSPRMVECASSDTLPSICKNDESMLPVTKTTLQTLIVLYETGVGQNDPCSLFTAGYMPVFFIV